MKLYDVEQSGQEGLVDAGIVDAAVNVKKPGKKSFDGFKV